MIHATINNKNFHIKKKFIRTFLDSKDNIANPNRKKEGGKKYIRNLRNQEPRQSMISTLTRSHSTRWRESKGGEEGREKLSRARGSDNNGQLSSQRNYYHYDKQFANRRRVKRGLSSSHTPLLPPHHSSAYSAVSP